jgi:hypothetical protein
MQHIVVLRHKYLEKSLRELRKNYCGRSVIAVIVTLVTLLLLTSNEGAYASGKINCLKQSRLL